jgi:hypothetical protein
MLVQGWQLRQSVGRVRHLERDRFSDLDPPALTDANLLRAGLFS